MKRRFNPEYTIVYMAWAGIIAKWLALWLSGFAVGYGICLMLH